MRRRMLASATLVSLVGLAWAAPGCKSATEIRLVASADEGICSPQAKHYSRGAGSAAALAAPSD